MNLSNLSIVIGPNLFELTNDEMVNLNITVVSSEIYKNILRIRKYERDCAEGLISNESIAEKNDNDSMIMKNLDGSLNIISELPQSHTSINDILNNTSNVNIARKNSIIKTIFIDHIKEKIQKRKSSMSLSGLKIERKKTDLNDETDSENLRSDEYRGYDIFNKDDYKSMPKLEPSNWSRSNDEVEDGELKHYYSESYDDCYNSACNQDSGLLPDNANMETICEESYDSLNKNSADKVFKNENQGTRKQKRFQHNVDSDNSESILYNEAESSDEGMSCISSIDDTEIIKQNSKINKENQYSDLENEISDNSEKNNEIIEILGNNIKEEKYKEKKEKINDYLTNEEIKNKVSSSPTKDTKGIKFNTIGPKSNIKDMLNHEESNLKDVMSTTNLDDKENDLTYL